MWTNKNRSLVLNYVRLPDSAFFWRLHLGMYLSEPKYRRKLTFHLLPTVRESRRWHKSGEGDEQLCPNTLRVRVGVALSLCSFVML